MNRGLTLPQFGGFPLSQRVIDFLKLPLGLGLGGVIGLAVVVASTMSSDRMLVVLAAIIVPFGLLLVGSLRRPLLAVAMVETALDFTYYYNFQQPDKGQISGYTISLTTVALCGLYAIWFAELLAKHRPVPQGVTRMALPAIVYVILASVTSFWAPSFHFSTFEMYQITHALLLFIYLVATMRTREDFVFVVMMVGVGIIIQSFSQIFVFTTGHNIAIGPLKTEASNTYVDEFRRRPGGFIGSPIDAASLYEIYIPALLSLLLIKIKPLYKWLVFVSLGMGFLGLALAQSRMGWAMILFSCGIVCFFAWRRGMLPVWVPLLAVFGAMVLLFSFQDVILERFTNDDNGSARSRVVMIELGFQVLRDHPVFGVGINNFAAVVKHYLTPDFSTEWFYAIHNKYLLLWVEVGLPALFAFIWYLIATLRRSWRVWQRNDPQLSLIALAFGAGILSQMLHMFVDVFHSKPQVQALWIAAALIAAMYRNFNSEDITSKNIITENKIAYE